MYILDSVIFVRENRDSHNTALNKPQLCTLLNFKVNRRYFYYNHKCVFRKLRSIILKLLLLNYCLPLALFNILMGFLYVLL